MALLTREISEASKSSGVLSTQIMYLSYILSASAISGANICIVTIVSIEISVPKVKPKSVRWDCLASEHQEFGSNLLESDSQSLPRSNFSAASTVQMITLRRSRSELWN